MAARKKEDGMAVMEAAAQPEEKRERGMPEAVSRYSENGTEERQANPKTEAGTEGTAPEPDDAAGAMERTENTVGGNRASETEISEPPDSEPERRPGKGYIIHCPKPVNKEIGGVLFVRGLGRTSDSFTASWFRNKGYTVEVAE